MKLYLDQVSRFYIKFTRKIESVYFTNKRLNIPSKKMLKTGSKIKI